VVELNIQCFLDLGHCDFFVVATNVQIRQALIIIKGSLQFDILRFVKDKFVIGILDEKWNMLEEKGLGSLYRRIMIQGLDTLIRRDNLAG
jgi:hypothetical protein